jgi:hypothetical protein
MYKSEPFPSAGPTLRRFLFLGTVGSRRTGIRLDVPYDTFQGSTKKVLGAKEGSSKVVWRDLIHQSSGADQIKKNPPSGYEVWAFFFVRRRDGRVISKVPFINQSPLSFLLSKRFPGSGTIYIFPSYCKALREGVQEKALRFPTCESTGSCA